MGGPIWSLAMSTIKKSLVIRNSEGGSKGKHPEHLYSRLKAALKISEELSTTLSIILIFSVQWLLGVWG
jgi:hypothetical protein